MFRQVRFHVWRNQHDDIHVRQVVQINDPAWGYEIYSFELVLPRIQKFRPITHFVKSRKVMGMRKFQQPKIRTAMLLAGSSYTPRAFRVG